VKTLVTIGDVVIKARCVVNDPSGIPSTDAEVFLRSNGAGGAINAGQLVKNYGSGVTTPFVADLNVPADTDVLISRISTDAGDTTVGDRVVSAGEIMFRSATQSLSITLHTLAEPTGGGEQCGFVGQAIPAT
jgi:hypothetical protein